MKTAEDRAHAEGDRRRDEMKGLKRELTAGHRELLTAAKDRHAADMARPDAEKRAMAADVRSRSLKERLLAKPLAAPNSSRALRSGESPVPTPNAASTRRFMS